MRLETKCRPGWTRYLRDLSVIVLVSSLMASPLFAKRKDDEIVLKNGDHLTGEIKKLTEGTLFFKPGYASQSIQIDWTKIERLESKDNFIVNMTSGAVYKGLIERSSQSSEPDGQFTITDNATVVKARPAEVIVIQQLEGNRWRQLTGSVAFGFSFASGNSQTQLSLSADASYRGEKNVVTTDVETNISSQTDGVNTTRESFSVQYARLVSKRWSIGSVTNLLSSSQQQLTLRTTVGGAVGRSLLVTDRTNFIAFGGTVMNREKYNPDSGLAPLNTNAEALVGFTFRNFHFDDFDTSSTLQVYPSISEWGRVRISSNSAVSWEFIHNLYWAVNVYENFDSSPPVNAAKNDFGITTSLNWKF